MTIAQNMCTNTNLYLVDHLYQYFSSAQTEEQKLQRIRDFLKGYCMVGVKYLYEILWYLSKLLVP